MHVCSILWLLATLIQREIVLHSNGNGINFLKKNNFKILTVKVSRENNPLAHFTVTLSYDNRTKTFDTNTQKTTHIVAYRCRVLYCTVKLEYSCHQKYTTLELVSVEHILWHCTSVIYRTCICSTSSQSHKFISPLCSKIFRSFEFAWSRELECNAVTNNGSLRYYISFLWVASLDNSTASRMLTLRVTFVVTKIKRVGTYAAFRTTNRCWMLMVGDWLPLPYKATPLSLP